MQRAGYLAGNLVMHWDAAFALLGLALSSSVHGYDASRHLWYDTPGTGFNEGLAIGNGRIGALVLGSASERIILNENSVWSGGFQDRINNASLEAFPRIRELLINGNLTEVGELVLEDMSANPTTNRAYSVTNDLVFDLGHSEDDWDNYERWLDTLQGNAGVAYGLAGVTYKRVLSNTIELILANRLCSREVIAHFDSGVIAVRINASEAGVLSANVGLSRSQGILWQGASLDNNTVTMDVGGENAGSIAFSSGVRVASDGGIHNKSNSWSKRKCNLTPSRNQRERHVPLHKWSNNYRFVLRYRD